MRFSHLVTALGPLAAFNLCGGEPAARQAAAPEEVLRQTWAAYLERFVTADGRVVDPKAGDGTTSEGQAYAMLRAVWLNDRAALDRTHSWAVRNLNRGIRPDHLWAWKWGEASDGTWGVLDPAFAADADLDAALALLLAAKVWNEPSYLDQARAVLADLWEHGTVVAGGRRFLLAGDTLCEGDDCRLNPSYYAPYAFRLFARYDASHEWSELVDTSYFLLETNSGLTATGLPSDWILLDRTSGSLRLGNDSQYSYDAFRTHWRVALDSALFEDERAHAYLERSLTWLVNLFRKEGTLPASISSRGESLADYESLEMLATLMPAVKDVAPDAAEAMAERLEASLADGLWGDRESYYVQNWAWFGTALYSRILTPFEGVRETARAAR
jgi:endoglucanase